HDVIVSGRQDRGRIKLALQWFARNQGGSVFATLERQRARRQLQVPLRFLRPMTTQAGGFQQGFDFGDEVNLDRSRQSPRRERKQRGNRSERSLHGSENRAVV